MADTKTDDAAGLQISVTRKMFISAPREAVFDFLAAEDVLPKILTGYGLVPGVAFTSEVSAPWNQPGSHRVVHLADGSTANEGLTGYDRSSSFAYRVSNPSSALKHLMAEAQGQFWFETVDNGTMVRWTYNFLARNHLAKLPLALFVKSQWKVYMDVCLANVVKQFAGPAAAVAVSSRGN